MGRAKSSFIIAFIVAVILFFTDTITKLTYLTQEEAWHQVPHVWYAWVGPIAAVALIAIPWMRIAGCLYAAGVTSNTLWTYNSKGVANPFISDPSDGFQIRDIYGYLILDSQPFAYNLSDIYITIAGPIFIVGTIIYAWFFAKKIDKKLKDF